MLDLDCVLQKVAIVLADGTVELLASVEDDLWEETAEDTGLIGPGGPELTAKTSDFRLPGAFHSLTECPFSWIDSTMRIIAVHLAGRY